MSRGLGKVQRAVLDELQRRAGPCSADGIAWRLANADNPDYGHTPPSRAQQSAVCRAIHMLQNRGLVRCAHSDPRMRDEHVVLLCWLPSHTAPEDVQSRMPGTVVERAIIREAEKFLEINDWFAVKEHNGTRYVRWGCVTGAVWKLLAKSNNDQRVYPAMSRAIRRLQERGVIRPLWFVSGRYKEKYMLLSVASQGKSLAAQHLENEATS